MSNPRFSVVIPTRERASTLRHTLATCLAQDFDDYEVIVCDNFSSPATRAVVDELAAPRVRYIRAPEPLAMSANWELAVSEARGEFVTVLGDDDGLMPYALRELDQLIAAHACKLVHWQWAFYTWPTLGGTDDANYLLVPMNRELRRVDARPVLAEVAALKTTYTALPMIYLNGLVHRDLIAAARAKAGRVFPSRIPDVYTGIVFPYLAGDFVSVSVPMTIAGLSAKSNGFASMYRDDRNPIVNEFDDLNARFGFRPHPQVPDLRLLIGALADSYFFARDCYFPDDAALAMDRKELTKACVAALWTSNPDHRRQAIRLIRDSLADRPDLQAWFDATDPMNTPLAAAPRIRPAALGSDGGHLRLSADRFGVGDVAAAVQLCARLLGYDVTGIHYDLPSHAAMYVQRDRDCRDRDEMIQALLRNVEGLQATLDNSWSCLPHRVAHRLRQMVPS